MSYLLTTLTKKREVDSIIRDTIDKVLVLRFGKASDAKCLQLDDILAKSAREVSKFCTIALVDTEAEEIQVYVKYFDITLAIFRGAMKGKLIVSCPLPPERIPRFQLLFKDV
ncbi:hypothetical protein MKW92_026980 [Papaver armeniacum]|nr:hypothetical protein MKW92_026980 [Papaver armeniacum]